MSIQAVAWVIENSEARLGARLVLIAIANHADRHGQHAYPSLETMAVESRMSRRQVINAVKVLESEGHVRVKHGAGLGGQNGYEIVGLASENISPPSSEKISLGGVKGFHQGSEKSSTEVVKNPNPSSPPPLHPSPSLSPEPFEEPKAGGGGSLRGERDSKSGKPVGLTPPAAPTAIFRIPESIQAALLKAPKLGAYPRLKAPAWWQAELRANPGVNFGKEILRAEAWLTTHVGKRKYLAVFLHNWFRTAECPDEAGP